MKKSLLASALILAILSSANVYADETITTTASEDTSLTAFGYTSGGDIRLEGGQKFTTTVSGTVSSILFSVTIAGGTPADQVEFAFYTDSGGSPGTKIASSSPVTIGVSGACNAVSSDQTASITATLPAGTYWGVVGRTGAQSDTNFYRPCGAITGTDYKHKYDTGWNAEIPGTMRLSFTVVEAVATAKGFGDYSVNWW